MRKLSAVLIALALCASAHAASAVYQGDLADAQYVQPLVGATTTMPPIGVPVSDAYGNDMIVLTTEQSGGLYHDFDPTTGDLLWFLTLPPQLNIDPSTRAAVVGQMGGAFSLTTTHPTIFFYTALGQLIDYDMDTGIVSQPFTGAFVDVTSLAAMNENEITALAMPFTEEDHYAGFSIDRNTGQSTEVFGFAAGSGSGQLNGAKYESYGPDGLVYVLDYGNHRVQVFAPCRDVNNNPCNYAFVRAFAIDPGVQNTQFAIGPTGNLYLPNGAGGGYEYGPNGNFLGTFGLPAGYVNNQPLYAADYLASKTSTDPMQTHDLIMTDAFGHVLVLDQTGMHIYMDNPATIENLITQVQGLGLPQGNTNSLFAKLRAAQGSLNQGNNSAARNQLNAFEYEVAAMVQSGQLTETAAAGLVGAAQDIMNALPA